MTRVYYRDAVACMIFFDITRSESFRSALKWKYDLDEKVQLPNGQRIPCMLVGNKVCIEVNRIHVWYSVIETGWLSVQCDLDERPVSREEIDSFCEKNGFTGWIEMSVKKNYNLDRTAR